MAAGSGSNSSQNPKVGSGTLIVTEPVSVSPLAAVAVQETS